MGCDSWCDGTETNPGYGENDTEKEDEEKCWPVAPVLSDMDGKKEACDDCRRRRWREALGQAGKQHAAKQHFLDKRGKTDSEDSEHDAGGPRLGKCHSDRTEGFRLGFGSEKGRKVQSCEGDDKAGEKAEKHGNARRAKETERG